MSQQYNYSVLPIKKGIFHSLSVPNFRLYIIGHFISMTGAWMQIVALSWLVWKITGSGDWLGTINFASNIPILILGLIGGAVADRFLRYNLILFTQTLLLIQAAILAFITLTDIVSVSAILILVIFSGVIYAFDFPARQSFIMDMVGKDMANNAVALSSSVVNLARVLGPALSGIIVAYWSIGICFVINAVTFLALILAIGLMNISKLNSQPKHNLSMMHAVKEGLKTAWCNTRLRKPFILLVTMSMFGIPYYVLVPIFVDEIYHSGSELYGFMMATSAAGALLGSLIVAKSVHQGHLRRNMSLASIGFAISVLVFAWIKVAWIGIVTMFFIGLFALTLLASVNAWLQIEVKDVIRGRIMSIFTILFFGAVPFGALISGFLAQRIGVVFTLTIGGSICLFFALWFVYAMNMKREVNTANFTSL